MSKIFQWSDILNSEKEYINIFGYGSLINHFSHDYDIESFNKAKAFGFKRTFDINHPIEMFEERDNRYQMVSKLLNEDYIKSINRLSLNNRGGLNVIKSNNHIDFINGLILKIPAKDFESVAEREPMYNLHHETFHILDDNNNVIGETDGYILLSKENVSETDVIPYYLYYKSCRSGAYLINKKFGFDFDKTTYLSDYKTLAIDWFKNKYFSIGQEVEIISINYTLLLDKSLKWHLTKNFNNKGIVVGYDYNFILVEISKGNVIPFDTLDLSPIF